MDLGLMGLDAVTTLTALGVILKFMINKFNKFDTALNQKWSGEEIKTYVNEQLANKLQVLELKLEMIEDSLKDIKTLLYENVIDISIKKS